MAVVAERAVDASAALAMMCDLTIAVEGAVLDGRAAGDIAARGDVDLVVPDEQHAIDDARKYLRYWFQK